MPTISTQGRRPTAMLLLALAGCGDGTLPKDTFPREAVSGTVNLDGRPLGEGTVQFNPLDLNQGAPVVVAGIKDGKFSTDRATGPVPGKYKISISSRAAIKVIPGEPPGPLPKSEPEKVPAQYNSKSTITKEVTGGGTNAFEFDLKGG